MRNEDNNFIKNISIKYAIKYNTLRNKYNKYYNNKHAISIDTVNFNGENRGGSNKIFTDIEEKELYEYIKNNFIDKNKPLTNNIIKEIASTKFKNKNSNLTFNMSDGLCTIFKKRWNLILKK